VGLDRARKELAVSFEEVGRDTVTRVVPAAPDARALIRQAAWLAGNLVRDEASELVPRHAGRGVVLLLRHPGKRDPQLAEDQLHQPRAVETGRGIGASEDIRHS